MQLLANKRPCPFDLKPLPYASIDAFRPNYSLMHVVSAFNNRDDSHRYLLEAGQLQYSANRESFLGEGGGGIVYRGADPRL
jgi:hypothetical protein